MTNSRSDLNRLPRMQCEEIFSAIEVKFMCSQLQWRTLIASSPWGGGGEGEKKREIAALVLFMFTVIINICIQSPSYKQNKPTLQSLMPELPLLSL